MGENKASTKKGGLEPKHMEIYLSHVADTRYHALMLMDTPRMQRYKEAVLAKGLLKDKVVMDLGTGSGIMAIFCAQAGAKKVYAVEQSDMADVARENIKASGLDHIIEVVKGRAEEIDLPEKMDAIVSEWMGTLLIGEAVLPFVLETRDKWLKPNGLLYPDKCHIYLAPIIDPQYAGRIDEMFRAFPSSYGANFDPLRKRVQEDMAARVFYKGIYPENLKATASEIGFVDLNTSTVEQGNNIPGKFSFKMPRDENLHGFVCWFDTDFPGGVVLSTGPFAELSSWRQGCMYFEQPLVVKAGDVISGDAVTKLNEEVWGTVDLIVDFDVNGKNKTHKKWNLGWDHGQLYNQIRFDCPM